ncbi:unnamed protein product [Closterium sp. Naga37s-1]|nr:unnamed protein product [Closterium sp. Naga37s-1]
MSPSRHNCTASLPTVSLPLPLPVSYNVSLSSQLYCLPPNRLPAIAIARQLQCLPLVTIVLPPSQPSPCHCHCPSATMSPSRHNCTASLPTVSLPLPLPVSYNVSLSSQLYCLPPNRLPAIAIARQLQCLPLVTIVLPPSQPSPCHCHCPSATLAAWPKALHSLPATALPANALPATALPATALLSLPFALPDFHASCLLPLLCPRSWLDNNKIEGSLPTGLWLDNNKIEGSLPTGLCSLPLLWRFNNYLYGPLPDCLFDKCINQIDVSGNSLYGRINRDFKHMVANSGAPRQPGSQLLLWGSRALCCWLQGLPHRGAGLKLRVSLSGNCLTLSPSTECSVNATQRSTAACQAFCSITDNGPCDGHGVCVPADPTSAAASRTASPSNFTCLCDAGYSTLDSGNGSTCAIVNSTTTTALPLLLHFSSASSLLPYSVYSFTPLVVHPPCPHVCAEKWEGLDVCEQFSLQQMLKATNNWSEDNVLGKGGFDIVYKGRSSHGQLWAIKRSTIMTNDFETEHREQQRAWRTCMGLTHPSFHRDIKPANILVTGDMQAKVADFGLLKRLTHGDADATRVAGTPGYVDPDYNRTNVITAKSDVFSFGIVLLELLSGKPPRAMKRVEAYDLEELRDSKMPVVSEEAIVDFADLALDCIKSPGTRRPTMKDVACRLSALIAKHCPDREDEWESVAKEESEGNEGISSRDVSAASFESSGREAERSHGSHSNVSSFMRVGSIGDGLWSWLQLKSTKGR